MGTLEKDGSSKPLSFDGKASSWPPFKTALHKFLDKEGCSWVVEGGNAFCVMLPAAAAKAAKSKTASEKGTVPTNVADYAKKDLQAAFTSATVTTSVLLELISNRKTVLGSHHADNEKLGMTEDQLTQAHAVLDGKRLAMVNRTRRRPSVARCSVPQQHRRVASHYQAQVHPQDARGYQYPPGRETAHRVRVGSTFSEHFLQKKRFKLRWRLRRPAFKLQWRLRKDSRLSQGHLDSCVWRVPGSNPTCGQASLQATGIQPRGDKEDVWAFNSSSASQPRQFPRRNLRFEGNQQHPSDHSLQAK